MSRPVTINISVEARWWVHPIMFAMLLAVRCGVPLDAGRCARIICRGLIPVVH